MRYFIELSYHGKNYHGWQRQPNANTVQETLEKALSVLLSEKISVVGCGRTDSGVHAGQFFAHFDFTNPFDKEDLKYKLNSYLPVDIAIREISLVHKEAHTRFDAISRKYRYVISLTKNPFYTETALYLKNAKLDVDKMNKAAKILFEYKNFKCFSRSNTEVKTYDCEIMEAEWEKEKEMVYFTIKANRFLRNMVRAIVGTLLEVGKNQLSLVGFREIIESKDRTKAGASVKAKGLFLTEIKYPNNIYQNNDQFKNKE